MKKRNIILIICCMFISVIAIFSYSKYTDAKLYKAEELYDNGKYYLASDEIRNIIYLGNNKTKFDEIKYTGYIAHNYEMYSRNIDNENIDDSIHSLLLGVRLCDKEKNNKRSKGEEKAYIRFRDLYYGILQSDYYISKEDADSVIGLEVNEFDIKLEELVKKANDEIIKKEAEQNELIENRKRPIIVKNIKSEIKDSTMIIEGDAYNKSDLELKNIEINIEFTEFDGSILFTETAYVTVNKPMKPDETIHWSLSTSYIDLMYRYRISSITFDKV